MVEDEDGGLVDDGMVLLMVVDEGDLEVVGVGVRYSSLTSDDVKLKLSIFIINL